MHFTILRLKKAKAGRVQRAHQTCDKYFRSMEMLPRPIKSRARQPVRAVHFLSGEVREFESGVQAAHNLQLRQPNICAVLAGRLRKTGGWTFEKLDRSADFCNLGPRGTFPPLADTDPLPLTNHTGSFHMGSHLSSTISLPGSDPYWIQQQQSNANAVRMAQMLSLNRMYQLHQHAVHPEISDPNVDMNMGASGPARISA
eukprot:Filipodium_phascolosomae@DN1210_c0_g1_i1.p1